SVRVTRDIEQWESWREAFRVVQAFEVWQTFGPFLSKHDAALGPGVADRMAFARTVSAENRDCAQLVLDAAKSHIEGLISPGKIVVLPTAPCIAPERGATGKLLDAYRTRVMRLTCIAGLSGLPQVTLPAGLINGCPVGLSFIGWRNSDEALL